MELPLSADQLRRLPRHPDWKYELIAGVALLSPRPRPLSFLRQTDRSVPSDGGARARPVDDAERAGLAALLQAVWADEDPYRSLDPARDRGAADPGVRSRSRSTAVVSRGNSIEIGATLILDKALDERGDLTGDSSPPTRG